MLTPFNSKAKHFPKYVHMNFLHTLIKGNQSTIHSMEKNVSFFIWEEIDKKVITQQMQLIFSPFQKFYQSLNLKTFVLN